MSSQIKTVLIVIGVIAAVGLAFWSYKKSSGPSIPNLTPEDIYKQFEKAPKGAGGAPMRP